jgi:hypothetical protein
MRGRKWRFGLSERGGGFTPGGQLGGRELNLHATPTKSSKSSMNSGLWRLFISRFQAEMIWVSSSGLLFRALWCSLGRSEHAGSVIWWGWAGALRGAARCEPRRTTLSCGVHATPLVTSNRPLNSLHVRFTTRPPPREVTRTTTRECKGFTRIVQVSFFQ